MTTAKVRYIVNDVKESINFYTELLGFRVIMHPAPGFAALKKGNLILFLNQPGAGGAGKKTSDGQTPTPGGWNRIQLPVDDLDSFFTELQTKGGSFRNDPVEGKGGKQVLLQDPSGNFIELFESTKDKGVQPIPDGHHTVTPYLVVKDVNKQIAFIEEAFNGIEIHRSERTDGSVMHAEVQIGDSIIMIGGTKKANSMPCNLHLYVEDVDAVYEQAVQSGGETLREPSDQFYGDRSAGVRDRWGNQWWIATHIEEVPDEELKEHYSNQ